MSEIKQYVCNECGEMTPVRGSAKKGWTYHCLRAVDHPYLRAFLKGRGVEFVVSSGIIAVDLHSCQDHDDSVMDQIGELEKAIDEDRHLHSRRLAETLFNEKKFTECALVLVADHASRKAPHD